MRLALLLLQRRRWAPLLRNGRLRAAALFLRQKVLVFTTRSACREISRVSPTFVKSAKRGQSGKKTSPFPTLIALNGPQSQKRASFVHRLQMWMWNCLHIKYFLCCSFHRKMGFLRFPTGAGGVRGAQYELTLFPNAGKADAINEIERGRTRALDSVSNSYHTATQLGFAFSEFGKGVHTLRGSAPTHPRLPPSLPWRGRCPIIHPVALTTNFTIVTTPTDAHIHPCNR